jgi:hypothetical protein
VPITPDTKSWTWVLERRCPECGFEATEIARDDLGEMIRENARYWRAVLARPGVARRRTDSMWSPLEYACHVGDVFRIGDMRLQRMLHEDDPTFANWDQDATAIEDRYGEQDPGTVVTELDEAAARLAEHYAAVRGAQWERTGMRSDGANFTVESFGRYVIHDVIHHAYDVETLGD